MESRFSHLSQRDSSVSMLRIKMSRQRSQTQKENRARAVSRYRGLDQLPELAVSELDALAVGPPETVDQGPGLAARQGKKVNTAAEERRKMLARYKEAKELQKEKEKRAIEKKGGIFRVGLYRPQPLSSLPQAPSAATRNRATALSSKVTHSMKQHTHKPLTQKENVSVPRKVETAVKPMKPRVAQKPQTVATANRCRSTPDETTLHAQVTRAATKSQTASLTGRSKTAPAEVLKTKASRQHTVAAPMSRGQAAGRAETLTLEQEFKIETLTIEEEVKAEIQAVEQEHLRPVESEKEVEGEVEKRPSSPPCSADPNMKDTEERTAEEKIEAELPPSPSSFAPHDFVFQPPTGLSRLLPTPLEGGATDTSLAPSPRDDDPPAAPLDSPTDPQPCAEPTCTSPLPPPALPQAPCSTLGPQEPKHDVPYFRAVLASEVGRLTGLCEQWCPRAEEPSIPEEMRDRVRTAVGQARLLMRERFGQFEGLVDDCDLGRGEKTTTCTDLQGFWDMVYYQVEDVTRKFNALKEAESRGWQEEQKPLPRIKRAVKKPPSSSSVVGKGGAGAGASAAAKSRLAAVKAAMKAKRAAQTQSAVDRPEDDAPTEQLPRPEQTAAPSGQTVVFHGGFFQVESPAKVPGSLRRSSCFRTTPCPSSKCTTPARHRSAADYHPSPVPQLTLTPDRQSNLTPNRASCHTPRPFWSGSTLSPPSDHSDVKPSQAENVEACISVGAIQGAQATPCTENSASCSKRFTPKAGSPASCTKSPATLPERPASDAERPASCTESSTYNPESSCLIQQLEFVQSDLPPSPQEPAAEQAEEPKEQTGTDSRPAPLIQSPENANSQTAICDRLQAEAQGRLDFVVEVTDDSAGQSEPVAEPEVDGPSSLQSVALSSSCPVGSVEALEQNDSVSLSPSQRAESTPAEWKGLSFTLSPCSSLSTPNHGLPSFCSDSSLTGPGLSHPSLPLTPVSVCAPLSSQTPADGMPNRAPAAVDVHVDTTPERSYGEVAVAMETSSSAATPVATDVQMESPRPQQEDQPSADAVIHTALPGQLAGVKYTPTLHTQRHEDPGLVLFTPEQREGDFMMFASPFGH